METQQFLWGGAMIVLVILVSLQYTLNRILLTLQEILRTLEIMNDRNL